MFCVPKNCSYCSIVEVTEVLPPGPNSTPPHTCSCTLPLAPSPVFSYSVCAGGGGGGTGFGRSMSTTVSEKDWD